MHNISITITLMFNDPFWQMLIERESENTYEVCKVTFGAEPKDYEVYAFLLANYHRLSFAVQDTDTIATNRKINPKRQKRLISQQLKERPISTKAQAALQQEYEQRKNEHKHQQHLRSILAKEQAFALRTQKRKNKHKGH